LGALPWLQFATCPWRALFPGPERGFTICMEQTQPLVKRLTGNSEQFRGVLDFAAVKNRLYRFSPEVFLRGRGKTQKR